ncbi:hypothetical protein KR222_011881 [Zaprionus bogoriensis]|nr:hypothetical protein KR222_011881 [Zaprionus bogoriensis]
MDYANNYAQIGGYGLSMPAVQLFYPEMINGKSYAEDASDRSRSQYDDSHFKPDIMKAIDVNTPVDLNHFYDSGNFKEIPKSAAIDLNHFYDGGDFKQPNVSDRHNNHTVDYGSQHYVSGSASSYRCMARQSRRDREMRARNGL